MALISFVIPVFRNEGSLALTHEKICGMLAAFPDLDAEFVFINDGSDDNSLAELKTLRSIDERVSIICFSRNFGQVPAIVAGLREAHGDAMVVLSADLQDPVELIAEMIRDWRAGNEVVIGYRVSREDSLLANSTSKLFYNLIRISNPKMPPGGFDFVLLDRKPCEALKSLEERNRFFQGDILWLGFRTKFLPYHRQKRMVGKSQWTFFKKLKYFIDGFLSTSYLAIRLMSLVGVIVASTGFLYALVIFYARLAYGEAPKGWAPVMIVMLFLGGLGMLMLGIIGEYIWRIYDETRRRPLYIVDEKFTSSHNTPDKPEPASLTGAQ